MVIVVVRSNSLVRLFGSIASVSALACAPGCADESEESNQTQAAGDGDGDGAGDGDGDGDGTGDGDGDGTGDGDGDGDGDGLPRWDVGTLDGGGGEGCGGGGEGEIEFSYIWIASSGDESVAKINTMNLEEEGRYVVFPPAVTGGSPSRTSVNLNGDMAVANRCNQAEPVPQGCGGVTMIVAQIDDCVDKNDDDVIQTSTGPNDVLPWGEDECVLWHTPITARSNRPVAWTTGEFNPETCKYENPKVWTASSYDGDDTKARVYLLDGATGEIEQEIVIEGWQGSGYSIYGGAVDSNNDFWFVGGYSQTVGHVRFDDFSYEVITGGSTPYGSMVDSEDRVWKVNGTMSRYDPADQSWQTQSCGQACTAITQDADGWVWVGGASDQNNKLLRVDPDTMEIIQTVTTADIPGLSMPWGLAVDIEGYLWAVEMGTEAYKIDTETLEYWVYQNSSSMYTYSDMTGFGLKNVAGPQG